MDGRDLGKIRREGYFRGTKANVLRLQFAAIIIFATFGLGAYRM